MERGLTSFCRSCIMEGRIERTPTIILTHSTGLLISVPPSGDQLHICVGWLLMGSSRPTDCFLRCQGPFYTVSCQACAIYQVSFRDNNSLCAVSIAAGVVP